MASKCLDEDPIHDNINERWYYGDLSNMHPYEGYPQDFDSIDWDLYIFVEAKKTIFTIFVIFFICVYGALFTQISICDVLVVDNGVTSMNKSFLCQLSY